MKIAVTYENGNVFQHFGRTEQFKVYDVQDGKVVAADIIGSDGAGHEALAGLLADKGIDVIICGGCGGGAQAALAAAGVELCSGATGNCDDAVEAYLKGELTSQGVTCDHHDNDDEESGCGGNCGSGCGGCGGGCHAAVIIEGPNSGKLCSVHYEGTFDDGSKFDSSYDRDEPLEFECGRGYMIRGFDEAVVNMKVGEIVNIHLTPEEAYGPRDPQAIFAVDIEKMPGAEELSVDDQVYLQNQFGQPFPAKVIAKNEYTITFDCNHEMAGKALNFKIELIDVR